MPEPLDKELYEKVKTEIYKKHPQHSAYRSGLIVQEYKKRGGKYSGTKPQKTGLKRWFAEEWKNQRGEVGYSKKGDVYRPTKRITEKTPTGCHIISFSENGLELKNHLELEVSWMDELILFRHTIKK